MIKSRYMLTRIKYFKIFPSSYTCIVMIPYFYFMILKFICRYTKYLWIIKLSRTEVHFIFVFMSKLSYLPLLSMLKNSKNVVTFETTLICPQSRWLGVFISLICRYGLLGPTPQGSPGVGRNTFLSSPHLCFIIVFICDLFVSRDDPLMS